MRESEVKKDLRVVTNNGRWGTVTGRTCCWADGDGDSEHGEHVSCNYWDGWWYVNEDNRQPHVMQNAERLNHHGIRMFDGSYLPEYNDPRKGE